MSGEADYVTPLDRIGYGDLLSVEDYRDMVEMGALIDYDGFGEPVRDGFVDKDWVVIPSHDNIPEDATHILWFNR